MKNIPLNLLIEKNKLSSPSPWVILLEITLIDNTKLYFCKNTENINFNNNVYQAINFELEPTKELSRGEIPTLTLRVSNVTRILQSYLEDLNGGVGSLVKIIVINTAYLNENYSDFEMEFEILETQSDVYWVTFTLGAPNPMRRRFPLYLYIPDFCIWKFKSRECNYRGEATSCEKNLISCRALGNSHRFGGKIGLRQGGLRVV